ncbi:C-X-C motif chemokine 2 isoform X1 [Pangasianodon hypophthalmus]|uniref:C-X-C motif chemokine 2 isoform X1 n=1 Tax=Pangasianodon hypophthalmus TaxID=310915 RepID=UPI000EFE16A0|nr:C-X-C motif chemokine 2 isoform X1 [Pangasianodon hypophthalmus]
MQPEIAHTVMVFMMLLMCVCMCVCVTGVSVEPRCRCSGVESRRVGKMIERVELFPPNPHCTHTEIIATLKGSGQQICLDTKAPWVMKVIEKIMANHSP